MNSPTISYAIPVCNEVHDVQSLLESLIPVAEETDEIVVQVDSTKSEYSIIVWNITEIREDFKCPLKIIYYEFDNDFAALKNNLIENCTKDYIFQIDADERLGGGLLTAVKELLMDHPDVDVFHLPRINTVIGITDDYIRKMNWRTLECPLWPHGELLINFPDYQMRLWKNNIGISWQGKVHERLVGDIYHYSFLLDLIDERPPYDDSMWEIIGQWSIIHHKTFARQVRQNELYDNI